MEYFRKRQETAMRQTDGKALTLGGDAINWLLAGICTCLTMATYIMTPQASSAGL